MGEILTTQGRVDGRLTVCWRNGAWRVWRREWFGLGLAGRHRTRGEVAVVLGRALVLIRRFVGFLRWRLVAWRLDFSGGRAVFHIS